MGLPVAVSALMLSVAAYVVVTLIGAKPFEMVDLRVYYDSARHLFDGAGLYPVAASSSAALPFTYPPFAALVFTPLGWLPWVACRVVWQVASLVALWWICRCSCTLTSPSTSRSRRETVTAATLLTALALWIEPIRSTITYGQINLFIAAALLAGVTSQRQWVAGVTVGLSAGIKLIPGITGLYYLRTRRYVAVLTAVATALASMLIGLAVSPALTRQFFTATVFDPARAGNLAAVNNQSLRGALARITHQDVVTWWLCAVAVALIAGLVAVRACLNRDDRFGAFLMVQLLGLLISPISWNHHWIWVLPLGVWAVRGPLRHHRSIQGVTALWIVCSTSFVVSVLIARQTARGGLPSAGWLPWAEALYPLLGLATIIAVAIAHHRTDPGASTGRLVDTAPAGSRSGPSDRNARP